MKQAPFNFARRRTAFAGVALAAAATAASMGGGCGRASGRGRDAAPAVRSTTEARAAANTLLAGAEVVASGPGELAGTFDAPGTLYVFDEQTGVVVLRQ